MIEADCLFVTDYYSIKSMAKCEVFDLQRVNMEIEGAHERRLL